MTWSAKKLVLTGTAALALGFAGLGIGVKGAFNYSADAHACAQQQQCTDTQMAAKQSYDETRTEAALGGVAAVGGLSLLLAGINKGGYKRA